LYQITEDERYLNITEEMLLSLTRADFLV